MGLFNEESERKPLTEQVKCASEDERGVKSWNADGAALVKTSFLVVSNLATNIFLGTNFICRFIKGISPKERAPYSDQLMFCRDGDYALSRTRLDYWESRQYRTNGNVGSKQ